MNTLSLISRSDPLLIRKSGEVPDLAEPALQAFIDDLIRCGYENDGVGIAAPQVGRSLRLFIMAPRPNPRYPDAPFLEPAAMINPQILRGGGEIQKGWEGCLSVPGYRGLVPRFSEIEATYFDREGGKYQATFTGFLARIFQHEFDHLEGILFPERMEKDDLLISLEEFAALSGQPLPPS